MHEIVLVRCVKSNLWIVRCKIQAIREHGGLTSNFYVLTNMSSRRSLKRNEILMREITGMIVNSVYTGRKRSLLTDYSQNS